MQSWGSDSKFDVRRTDRMPTKSGVVGLLAAALGRNRNESIEDLVALKFGIRIDRQGTIINDFQVTEMIRDKGKRLNSNLSNRQYLSDAVFLAGFESDDRDLLEKLAYAIIHPVFPLFLGRRSCPPSQPILLGIRESVLSEALYDEPWLVAENLQHRTDHNLRIIVESQKEGYAVKRDVPISFSSYNREYRYRYMKELPSKIIKSREETILHETLHDPMKELR